MGTAIPFAEILVVDEAGAVAGPDQAGELVHCGPLVAQGYWNDPERTAERFKSAPEASGYRGTAVYSGDTVKRGADGLLYFVSRDDAMIKSSGNRISPKSKKLPSNPGWLQKRLLWECPTNASVRRSGFLSGLSMRICRPMP